MSKDISQFYDAVSGDYHLQYEEAHLRDTTRKYPANYFRLQMIVDSFSRKGIRRVVEVGVGEGTPLAKMAEAGMEVCGFDISSEMVRRSRETMQKHGLDPDCVFLADVQDRQSYARLLEGEPFDGLMAMGVMPHVEDERAVLRNMRDMVKPGGSVFIEFRNELFSLFTQNRYTHDFICNRLLEGVDDSLRNAVSAELQQRVRMDMPPVRATVDGKAPGYDAILSKFHNPFEVPELFAQEGFSDIRLLWYHYHPAFPWLEGRDKQTFREEAIRLEGEPSGWKGYFLCSAFVVEAVRCPSRSGDSA